MQWHGAMRDGECTAAHIVDTAQTAEEPLRLSRRELHGQKAHHDSAEILLGDTETGAQRHANIRKARKLP